jgi:D-3-phosphoglycerate dehydrogenase
MSKPFIVFSDGCDKEIFEAISKNPSLEVHSKPKITQDELKSLLPKIQGLVIRSATKVNSEILAMAPNLKYVVRAGEGTDNIDKPACAAKGVKVSNTPGANNNSAAEHAVALMMTVLRKTAGAHASMKKGEWNKDAFTGNELTHKTVGIMGFGRIGQLVAKRISGFEPQILFYDPMVKTSPITGATAVANLEELFSKSDIVTIHTPLVDATKGVVNQKLLNLMKPNAILINAARGKIVNEDDLYQALSTKKIRAAGFDVFAEEPLPTTNKLKDLDNLILTPHLGGSTEEAQFRVGEMAAHQIVEFFVNGKLLHEVKA